MLISCFYLINNNKDIFKFVNVLHWILLAQTHGLHYLFDKVETLTPDFHNQK